MEANVFRRCIVASWTACAVLCAGGASTYYVIDLSGGPNAVSYPMEILDGEPSGGWTTEHKTTKLVLRRIEAGEFMMCNQVSVTLTRPFFIGVFEVTSAQYAQVMGGSGNMCPKAGISYNTIRGNSSDSNYSWPGSANVDPSTFIGKLRTKTGIPTIDLPTEAQWEYACRAGTTTDFNNGTNWNNDPDAEDENLNQLGWYVWNSDNELKEVGCLQTNAWGLCDMHGNVSEWCLDRWSESLAGGNDPVGGTSSNLRIVRGGDYNNSASYCRASFRLGGYPSNGDENYGFRIACFPAEIVHSSTPYEGVYDGEGHSIAVKVDMPTNAVTSYALSEGGPYQTDPIHFTNATDGAETVWYKVEANGYDTVTSNSTVTITKATYDMTGVAWDYDEDEPFEGDGTVKMVALTNLPSGVSATYTGNVAMEPGTNTAHAVLSYDVVNYFEPIVADLTWVILPPMELGVEQIVGYPTTVGSNGVGRVEGIVDTTASGLRSVWLTGENNSDSWFKVVVTNATSVSFDWKCSCEQFSKGGPWDYLMFSVDGAQRDYICGTNNLYWTNVTFSLNSEGIQTLLWTYHKDGADAAGEDCAWVANVVITYAQEPEIRFTAISVEEGSVTVAVSMMLGESAQAISSAEVKNWLEATSDLSDWVGGRLPITVIDLTEDVAETVRFRVTFTNGAPPRAFLRIRKP